MINNKDTEIVELNKQQILFMNKHEKAVIEINNLNNKIKLGEKMNKNLEKNNNEKINEIKNLNNIIESKEILLKEKNNKINEQEKQIKLLLEDNIQWEQKYNDSIKEIENFKKFAMWDLDSIQSFKKIESLNQELTETKKKLEILEKENNNYKKNNEILETDLKKTKNNEEILTKENEELKIIKNKYDKILITLKDYLQIKKENENYKKEIPAMKVEYETKIINDKNNFEKELEKNKLNHEKEIKEIKIKHNEEIKNINLENQKNIIKLEDQIQTLKDKISILNEEINKKNKLTEELNNQLNKKNEILLNLKTSYDNLINKLKLSEEKLAQYELSKKNQKSVFDEEDNKELKENKIEKDNDNNLNEKEKEKITSTFDQFSFTKEVLNDYLYCLYLLETGISLQNLVNNLIGNLSLYSHYAFKLSRINASASNCPLDIIQNEFLEDIYFVSFDKYLSKKILSNKDDIYDNNNNNSLSKKLLKVNFEDFDQDTINEICLELINKNIMTKLKSPKTLSQLSQLFNTKYSKKFDFPNSSLNDYLSKDIIPSVQKRILRHNKSTIDEVRTLVELTLLLNNIIIIKILMKEI